MRETITFPRPYHRPLLSVLLVALLGALLLVLALPIPTHATAGRGPITVAAGATMMVQRTCRKAPALRASCLRE